MVGEQVDRRPELAAEVASRGHLVALHAYRHRLHLRMTPRLLEADIARGLGSLQRAIDRKPTLHRPPYGIYSPWGLRTVRGAGLGQLLWSRWGKDWRGDTTPERIAALAAQAARPGDGILLHDADFYRAPGCNRRRSKASGRFLVRWKGREMVPVRPF